MAATKKRAKELARAKEARRRARAADAAARHRRRQRIAVVTVAAIVLAAGAGLLLVSSLSDDGDSAAAAPDTGQQPVASCEAPGELQDEPKTFDAPGDGGLDASAAATFTLETNCGDIVIDADPAAAPQTVNAMAFLAGEDYFNNTLCHRVTTEGIFVLQCGDPTGSGSGGPGFTLPDENLPDSALSNYPAGTVAMANSGPGKTGSQFFVVYRDTTLPASYTIWGTVASGLDTVTAVAEAGTVDGSTDGTPQQALMIRRASVAGQ